MRGGSIDRTLCRALAAPRGATVLFALALGTILSFPCRSQQQLDWDDSFTTLRWGFDAGGNNDDLAHAIAVQADGKILVVGQLAGPVAGQGDSLQHAVVLSPEGILLDARGSGGGTAQPSYEALALQTDGKLLLTGYSANGSQRDFSVKRVLGPGHIFSDGFEFGTMFWSAEIGGN